MIAGVFIMFNILCIDHIVLRTHDVDNLVSFYCDVLGCKIEKKANADFIQLRAGDSLIDIIKAEIRPDDTGRNLEHFCLRIDNFNHEFLKNYFNQKNIEIYNYGVRNGAQGMGESVYLRDPIGNEIELKATLEKMIL
jgi:glyoxylase I family protein